jgi:hypothetical protein
VHDLQLLQPLLFFFSLSLNYSSWLVSWRMHGKRRMGKTGNGWQGAGLWARSKMVQQQQAVWDVGRQLCMNTARVCVGECWGCRVLAHTRPGQHQHGHCAAPCSQRAHHLLPPVCNFVISDRINALKTAYTHPCTNVFMWSASHIHLISLTLICADSHHPSLSMSKRASKNNILKLVFRSL